VLDRKWSGLVGIWARHYTLLCRREVGRFASTCGHRCRPSLCRSPTSTAGWRGMASARAAYWGFGLRGIRIAWERRTSDDDAHGEHVAPTANVPLRGTQEQTETSCELAKTEGADLRGALHTKRARARGAHV